MPECHFQPPISETLLGFQFPIGLSDLGVFFGILAFCLFVCLYSTFIILYYYIYYSIMNVEKESVMIKESDRKLLEEAYYKEGMCFGRDGLFHYLKKKHGKEAPSKRTVLTWLNNQKLQQEFKGRRSGGTTDFFKPEKPFNSISCDLLIFTGQAAQNFKYVLVVIDNFSRKM